jgi:hypothetical protein
MQEHIGHSENSPKAYRGMMEIRTIDVDGVGRGLGGERTLELLAQSVPDVAGDGVEHEEQPEGHDDDRQWVALLQRPDQHPLDRRGEQRRDRHAGDHRQPHRPSLLDRQYVGDERAEHRHLALGEVEMPCRAIDDRQRERECRVDGAILEGVEEALQEELHDRTPQRPK